MRVWWTNCLQTVLYFYRFFKSPIFLISFMDSSQGLLSLCGGGGGKLNQKTPSRAL